MNHRTLIITALSFFALTTIKAQDDFADLSVKQRISIAEKEEAEAAHDPEFQNMMQKGHELFKERHYLKAIHAYEKAQERRPYNVYPKVIIADIELSMKDTLATLRAAEKEELEKQKPQPDVKPDKPVETTPEPPTETPEERMKKLNDWEAAERKEREQRREAQKEKEKPADTPFQGDIPKLSTADYQKALAEQYPEGITENVTTEGNKVIVERIVVTNGIGNEYKKVTHNWGGVFYFKNGEAITDRVWKQETEK